jgi:hypothetical protein
MCCPAVYAPGRFINNSNDVLGKVVNAIFALWSLEIACTLCNVYLIVMAIRMLLKKHIKKIKRMQTNIPNDSHDEEWLGQSIQMSQSLKYFAICGAALSSMQWICAAFSFAIARYLDEACVSMEFTSSMYLALQSFLFDPSTCVKNKTLIMTLTLNCESLVL